MPYDLATATHDYAPWLGPPRRTILICTQPRSGSTLLGEALYFAGGLGCPLEYFHAGFRPRFAERWNAHAPDDFRRAVWRNRTDPGGVMSVKIMWRDVQELALARDPIAFADLQATPPAEVPKETYRAVARLLDELAPSSTCIHLYRRDRLRQAVSASIAVQTGQWRSLPGAEMERVREPDYDPETIERQIAYADFCYQHWRNLSAVMEGGPITLTYEDLVGNYHQCISDLLKQLGSTAAPPPARMQRQANGASEAFVLRYLRERARMAGAPTATVSC